MVRRLADTPHLLETYADIHKEMERWSFIESTLLIGRTIFPTTLWGNNQLPRLSELSMTVALVQRQMTLA